MDVTPIHLSDVQKDIQHVFVLLKLWLFEIRDLFLLIADRFEGSSFRDIKVMLDQQPIIICFKNVAEIVSYLGGLWLDSVLM